MQDVDSLVRSVRTSCDVVGRRREAEANLKQLGSSNKKVFRLTESPECSLGNKVKVRVN